MKLRAPAILLAIAITFAWPQAAHAQDPERLVMAREYIAASRVDATMATTSALLVRPILVQLLSKEQSLTNEIRDEFINRFETKFMAMTPEFAESFSKIIAAEFTAMELTQAIEFMKSPVGQHFLDFQPVMMQKGMEIGRVWGEKAGREAIEEVIREMRAEGKLKTL